MRLGKSPRYLSQRERREQGICTARCEVERAPGFPELDWHVCELSAHHFGNHLCWCGVTFTQSGLVQYRQRTMFEDGRHLPWGTLLPMRRNDGA
jgi:hypothetical protein